MSDQILIVEDEMTLRENIARYLKGRGYEVECCPTTEEARDLLPRRIFDVAIVDMRLPGKDGLWLAAELRDQAPETMILMMTAFGTVESVIEALRAGVSDYILKPVLLEDLARKVGKLCEHRRLLTENARLRRLLAEKSDSAEMIGESASLKSLLNFARPVAASNATLLIEGESGSGKEVLARQIHEWSNRSEGPFVAVNMSGIPDHLAESTLFGHEKGAFTGADSAREGLFRVSAAGTLFLDEIGEMPLAAQAKLLRAIETKEIMPVGSDRTLKASCRVMAATNRNLGELILEKKFRQDLYYRISVVKLCVPSLRERRDDIPILARHFLRRHTAEIGKSLSGIDSSALRCFLSYRWPGNVRELSNVIERAVLVSRGPNVTIADLPPEMVGGADWAEAGGLEKAVADFELAFISAALEQVGGDRREAARMLGISLATLYRRLEKLGLRSSEESAPPADGPEAK